jgi:hypothetical protein
VGAALKAAQVHKHLLRLALMELKVLLVFLLTAAVAAVVAVMALTNLKVHLVVVME